MAAIGVVVPVSVVKLGMVARPGLDVIVVGVHPVIMRIAINKQLANILYICLYIYFPISFSTTS